MFKYCLFPYRDITASICPPVSHAFFRFPFELLLSDVLDDATFKLFASCEVVNDFFNFKYRVVTEDRCTADQLQHGTAGQNKRNFICNCLLGAPLFPGATSLSAYNSNVINAYAVRRFTETVFSKNTFLLKKNNYHIWTVWFPFRFCIFFFD